MVSERRSGKARRRRDDLSFEVFGYTIRIREALLVVLVLGPLVLSVDAAFSAAQELLHATVLIVLSLTLPTAVRWPTTSVFSFVAISLLSMPWEYSTRLHLVIAWSMVMVVAIVARAGVALALAAIIGAWAVVQYYFILGEVSIALRFVIFYATPLFCGMVIRQISERLVESRRQVMDLERASQEVRQRERDRLARDLHDIVGHQLTVISMVSGSRSQSADLDKLQTALREIRVLSSDGVSELRYLLQVLRTEGSVDTSTASGRDMNSKTLQESADIFVARLYGLGFTLTRFCTKLENRNLPESTVVSAIRILQEAVTNIVKYAAPRSEVCMDLSADENWFKLRVESRIPKGVKPQAHPAARSDSNGEGLVSMRERALLLGGELSAGAVGDTWIVLGILPTSNS